jgi:hypothetical protein
VHRKIPVSNRGFHPGGILRDAASGADDELRIERADRRPALSASIAFANSNSFFSAAVTSA